MYFSDAGVNFTFLFSPPAPPAPPWVGVFDVDNDLFLFCPLFCIVVACLSTKLLYLRVLFRSIRCQWFVLYRCDTLLVLRDDTWGVPLSMLTLAAALSLFTRACWSWLAPVGCSWVLLFLCLFPCSCSRLAPVGWSWGLFRFSPVLCSRLTPVGCSWGFLILCSFAVSPLECSWGVFFWPLEGSAGVCSWLAPLGCSWGLWLHGVVFIRGGGCSWLAPRGCSWGLWFCLSAPCLHVGRQELVCMQGNVCLEDPCTRADSSHMRMCVWRCMRVCVCVCRCAQGNVLVLLMLPLHSYSQKNGKKYRVFRCDCVWWCAASKQENARWQVCSAGASPLTCSPNTLLACSLHFLYSRKWWECEIHVFLCYGTRVHAASSMMNAHQQVGSARASPLGFRPIASRPSLLQSRRGLFESCHLFNKLYLTGFAPESPIFSNLSFCGKYDPPKNG